MKIDRNLPNYLTILRIFSIPLILLAFYLPNSVLARQVAGGLFVIASLTDFFDGYFAKKYNLISNFGRTFDPIADKVLVACVLLMLAHSGKVNIIPCLIILSREFIVSGFREFLAQVKVHLSVSKLAKVKTILQMTSLAMIIIGTKGSGIKYVDLIGEILLWLSAIMSVITGYFYFKACSKYF